MDILRCVTDNPAVPLDDKIDALQRHMLDQPQVDCPVFHRYGPGIYIREVMIPAGTVAIGHYQRFEHLNVMLKGKVTVVDDNGNLHTLVAPQVFVGKPGRKMGYIHEDMVWQNIYATHETDVEKLEEMYFDKHADWHAHLEQHRMAQIPLLADRDDYAAVLAEVGVTEHYARAESEREDNMIPLPLGSYKVKVGDSAIEGKGLFATAGIEAKEVIAPARIGDKRTIAGRYTNHSKTPNARMVRVGNEVWLVAKQDIAGCKGGHDGEEITIDYRQALAIAIQMNREALCQE